MTAERENQPLDQRIVLNELVTVNGEVAKLLRLKDQHLLEADDSGKLADLNKRKDRLLIWVLFYRKEGNRSIKVTVSGLPQDKLHPYSRNKIEISFPHPKLERRKYRTTSNMKQLIINSGLRIEELIGEPDQYQSEEFGDYIKRTIAEIAELGHDLNDTLRTNDLIKKQNLEKLKNELASRIIRLRLREGLTRMVIEVKLLKDPKGKKVRDLMEVRFHPGKGESSWSFHIPTFSPFYILYVKPLVEELGGFDRETIDRRR